MKKIWLWFDFPLLTCSVTLGKLCNLSGPSFTSHPVYLCDIAVAAILYLSHLLVQDGGWMVRRTPKSSRVSEASCMPVKPITYKGKLSKVRYLEESIVLC